MALAQIRQLRVGGEWVPMFLNILCMYMYIYIDIHTVPYVNSIPANYGKHPH